MWQHAREGEARRGWGKQVAAASPPLVMETKAPWATIKVFRPYANPDHEETQSGASPTQLRSPRAFRTRKQSHQHQDKIQDDAFEASIAARGPAPTATDQVPHCMHPK